MKLRINLFILFLAVADFIAIYWYGGYDDGITKFLTTDKTILLLLQIVFVILSISFIALALMPSSSKNTQDMVEGNNSEKGNNSARMADDLNKSEAQDHVLPIADVNINDINDTIDINKKDLENDVKVDLERLFKTPPPCKS